jgi:hypothetical protein
MASSPNVELEPHNMAEYNTASEPMLFNPSEGVEKPDMPAVQDHAVAAAVERLNEGKPDATTESQAPQDVGEGWDPSLHESPPRRNRDGAWAKLRGRPKTAQKPEAPRRSFVNAAPDPVSVDTQNPQPEQTAPADDAAIQSSAEVSVGLFLAAGSFVFGEDFAPDDKREQSVLVANFAAYYKASGCPDLPPGLALAAGLAVYIGKRWSRPAVVEKRKSIFAWITEKIKKMRGE